MSDDCSLQPTDPTCFGQRHPLAVDPDRVAFSWSLHAAATIDAACVQTAYQLQVARSRAALDGDQPDLWDTRRVENRQARNIAYRGKPLTSHVRLWWRVRVWDQNGHASAWSAATWFETGPADVRAWQAQWIAPDINAFMDEPPTFGQAICPTQTLRADRLALRQTFQLPRGYPRCFGTAWIAGQGDITLEFNGRPCPAQPGGGATVVKLPWDAFRFGNNVIRLIGDTATLQRGVAFVARIHEAESGWRTWQSDTSWTAEPADGDPESHATAVVTIAADARALPPIRDDAPRRSVEMQRTFTLDAVPPRACINVAGLGTYILHINGHRVGDTVLSPGWTEYDRRVHFETLDVTDLLRVGNNTITATLGNGWWTSGMGWESRARFAEPDEPLHLLLRLEARDETAPPRVLLTTDHAWQWRPSRILRDTIYHGQTEDLRPNQHAWRGVKPLENKAERRLLPSPAEPIRVTATLTPVETIALPDGSYRFDFGQNHAGRPRLRGTFPAGTTLKVVFAEELQDDGTPYRENYRTAAATDVVIVGHETLDWSPCFTYRGYRYAVLTGLPEGVTPDASTLVSEVLHNDAAEISRFECSQPMLNRIDRIVRWGLRSNLHGVPTDCPQRDERLGWTGDVNLFATTSCWLRDLHGFYAKWLDDLCDAQLDDGGVTHVAPSCVVKGDLVPHFGPAAPVWGDIIVGLPDVVHRFYDDPALLARLYEPMKRWVAWYRNQADDTGLAKVDGFGDWVPVEETPPTFCGAAFHALACRLTAETAETLGFSNESAAFHVEAQRAADAFHDHYFDPDTGGYRPDTQTAQALPLAFDLPPAALRQGVADRLAQCVQRADGRLTTGFVGTAYLLPMLSKYGHHDLAYRVLHTGEYPSLGYMIEHGATTVWERWNSDKMGPDMNSRNHFCFGSMAQWMYEDLAGVRPDRDEPGFRHVHLRPRPVADVSFATIEYNTPHGTLFSRWTVEGDNLRYRVELPANTTATLTLSASDDADIEGRDAAGVTTVGRASDERTLQLLPGRYDFVCPLRASVPALA